MSVEELTSSEYRFVNAYFDVMEEWVGEWFTAHDISENLSQDISQSSISKNLSYLSREYDFIDRRTDDNHRSIYKVSERDSLEQVKETLENETYLRPSQKTIDEESVAKQVKADLEGKKFEELDLQVYIVNKLGEETNLTLEPRLRKSKEVVDELASLEDIEKYDRTYNIGKE